MENALFANVQKLYDNGLYECVIPTASLLSTVLRNDRNVATLEIEYQTMLYLSSANYEERHYRLACIQLDEVVLQRKQMLRYKSTHLTAIEASYPQFQDVELRYRMAICFRELGKYNMAISTLQAVEARTPKLNMLLGRLLHHHGRGVGKAEKAMPFKDVLRDCPMSLTSIETLIELGIDGSEVHSMVVNAAAQPKHIEWLSSWIKGHAQLYGCKHLEAARTFQHLNETTNLRQNEHLLTNIGKCMYYYGNAHQAEQYLTMSVMNNPYNMNALCPLSVVYEFNRKKKPEQDKLVSAIRERGCGEYTASHWFLFAQFCYMNDKYDRALTFTDRALAIDGRHIETLLLRGKILIGLGRSKHGVDVFRNVQILAPYRFEVYKGLMACYIRLKRFKDARNIAVIAVRLFRSSPRSYTMFGGTMFHSSNAEEKKNAKKFVEKALQIDEHYVPGIALMAGIYQYEGAPHEAIGLLRKKVANFPHPKLFAMLGELLSNDKDLDGALHYYTLALRLDPTFQRALDGVNALTKVARSHNCVDTKPVDVSSSCSGSGSSSSGSVTSVAGANGAAANHPLTTPCGTPNHGWLFDCEEMSNDVLEVSSPAVAQEDTDADTFSEPFWQDVDGETKN